MDINDALDSVIPHITSVGEANYAITRLLIESFEPASYSEYNALIGVLECAKLEFYRRATAPYEDVKRRENGDVYPPMKVYIDSSH